MVPQGKRDGIGDSLCRFQIVDLYKRERVGFAVEKTKPPIPLSKSKI
jgi:hypothetical protein